MSSMDMLLKSIVAAYFSGSYCLILISDRSNHLNILPNIPILNINLTLSQNFESLFNYIGCQEFIIDVKYPVSIFRDIEQEIKLHQDRFNRRKYVFLSRNNQEQNCLDIFESQEIQYVSELLVILEEINENIWNINMKVLGSGYNEIYSLWTHRYVGQTESNKLYLLDKWFSNNKSFLFNNNLFPDKLSDQKGRILRTAVFSYEPYIIIEPKNDTYLYMGSEMVTLLTFAEHHNMSIMPVINEFDYWGDIWENWSGNGLMGNLVEDKADVGGAALYTWGFAYKYLDISKPTVRTGITCLVPASKLASGWLTPVYAYSTQTWMAVIGTFMINLLTLYLLGILQLFMKETSTSLQNTKIHNPRFKANVFGNALMSVLKPFVLQSVTDKEMVKGFFGRYLMGLVFLTTLILSATYDSGLATIMTIPRYENPINTMDELVDNGLYWGGTQDAWIMSIEEAKEPKLIKLVSKFVATSESNLRNFSLTGEFAFPVERLPKDNYAIGNYIQEDVIQNYHLMAEDLYWEHCILMMRKNSILLPYVDIFVLRVFEADLISFWQNEAATKYMNQYVQKAVRYLNHHQTERGIVKLKMTHVLGAFGILAFGYGTALIVILMELTYYRLFKKVALN